LSLHHALQPLDVSGNDEFERKIKNSFINWYSDELSKGMKLGKAASDVKIDNKEIISHHSDLFWLFFCMYVCLCGYDFCF
jgi:hypothetical protein